MKAETAVYTAFDEHRPWDSAESEKNLMRAVLRTAMEDIGKSGESYRQARQYILSEEDFYPFSFVSICNHLNLCTKTIRICLGLLEEMRKDIAA